MSSSGLEVLGEGVGWRDVEFFSNSDISSSSTVSSVVIGASGVVVREKSKSPTALIIKRDLLAIY